MGHHFGFRGRRRSQETSRFVERRASIWEVFDDEDSSAGACMPVFDVRETARRVPAGPVLDVRSAPTPTDATSDVELAVAARLVWARAELAEYDDATNR